MSALSIKYGKKSLFRQSMVYVCGQNVRYKIYMLYYICGKYVYYCMFVYGNYRAGRLFLKSLLFQNQNFVQDKGQKSSEGIILFTLSLPNGERKNCPQNLPQDLNLTPLPIPEILCVKNVRAIVFCGFLIKYIV